MAAVGKVEILRAGTKVAVGNNSEPEGLNRRDIKMLMPRTAPTMLELQEPTIGEVLSFNNGLVFESASSYIVFQKSRSGNGLDIRGIEPPRTRFAPRVQLSDIVWNHTIGENPNHNPFETFGDPPLLTVEFLGHPDREMFAGIMSNQRESYRADYTLEIERRDITHACEPDDPKRTRVETILFAGPVVDTSINSYLHPDYTTDMDGVEEGYNAQLMLGAKVVTFSDTFDPSIELFGTTIAESDGLVRHYTNGSVDLNLHEAEKIPAVMRKLAEYSVFARSLQVAPPTEHIPMLLLRDLGKDMRLAVTSFTSDRTFASIREDTGFNWPTIRNGLHHKAVAAESERLHDVYIQAQLAAVRQ